MSNAGTGGWMQWWTGQGRYIHPKREPPRPPASAPCKTSRPVRAQHHSCDAAGRQKIKNPSFQSTTIPYQKAMTDTRRNRLVMPTLHVVGRHKFGSSIFLLEQSQMHWACDHIQSRHMNTTPSESSGSNRMQGWSYVCLGRADRAES